MTTEKKPNPIHFNPDGMTVGALKDSAGTLRTIFEMMDRGVDGDVVIGHLEAAREHMLRKYGASPV